MTFREAFLLACDLHPTATKGRAKLLARVRRADVRNKRVAARWARLEKKIGARYYKETGQKVGDWRDILQWLIDNLPAILKIILTILMLF
ncbi:hypothetical protein KKH23_05805 [Patescibacteria group bacterium]|nr:hypothetical protein [Patescibacteria group bacterium]